MIAIFKPVKNWPWMDLREFEIINWKPSTYTRLKISEYPYIISELPVFKPRVACISKDEYLEQFNDRERLFKDV